MDPITWNSWYQFSKDYCAGHQGPFGWDAKGATNIPELKQKISPYFLRRTKDEVLKELPPKRHIHYPVELDQKTKFEYELIEGSFVEYLRDIKKKTDKEIKRSMQAEVLVKLGELRQIASIGKIDAAKELIQTVIDGGEKVVVFSSYTEPLETLKEAFGEEAVLITGQTPQLFRKSAIDSFQDEDKVKIFFGGIRSTGMGITLTAASTVIFLDMDWTPSKMEQCEG